MSRLSRKRQSAKDKRPGFAKRKITIFIKKRTINREFKLDIKVRKLSVDKKNFPMVTIVKQWARAPGEIFKA